MVKDAREAARAVLAAAIRGYLKRSGVALAPKLAVDNDSMAISLATSTGGVAILPESIDGYLPPHITSRALRGDRPAVDLMLGYHKANSSPILKRFRSKIDALALRIYGQRNRWQRRQIRAMSVRLRRRRGVELKREP